MKVQLPSPSLTKNLTCSLALLASALWLCNPAAGQAGECPPKAGTEHYATTNSFFDVYLDFGGIWHLRASGPTDVSWSDNVRGISQIEIVSMKLSGKDPELGDIVVTLSKEPRSLGQAMNFTTEADGTCVATDSFFDIFVEISIPKQQLILFNPTPLRLLGNGPIPIPRTRGFKFSQDPQFDAPSLYDKVTGRRLGIIRNTIHEIPDPPCSCFPRAGLDQMYSKLGHTIEIPGIGIIAPLMSGPMVVTRSDPYFDAAMGLCCIDTQITSLNLWGFDPLVGSVHITLNAAHPSMGRICELNPGTCFPALSCFDVYIRVSLVDKGISFVNCDPIKMCCTINALPPFGCPYAVQNPPILLYKEIAGADVCNITPRPNPSAVIRQAFHTPEPPPVCPPPPRIQTSESVAHLTVETPLGTSNLDLKGPVTCEIKQGDLQSIPLRLVQMDLAGLADPRPTPVRLSLNRSSQYASMGLATNCRIDDRYGDLVADSFFDVFVVVEIPDPQDPGQILTLRNPVPVRMSGQGIPLIINRPFLLQQTNLDAVPLIDSAGNVLGRIINTVHELPPPPPPVCDCFPRAGMDRFISKLVHAIDIPGIGVVRADMEGPVTVRRDDPRVDPGKGLCVIDTEIVEMLLTGTDPLVGRIEIALNRKRQSLGIVAQETAAACFPAMSCFDIYIRVELKDLGIVLVNCAPIRVCCEIMSLPPYLCPYALQNPQLPLYREIDDPTNPQMSVCLGTALPPPVGFIVDAIHTPDQPVDKCACFPPAGADTMNTNLWHEIILNGVGTCKAALSGQVVVDRDDPTIDPVTGKCLIKTKMRSMKLSGVDPLCGKVLIELNEAYPSTGQIIERVPGTCFPADSFFDVFIKVTTDAGIFGRHFGLAGKHR